MYSVQNINFQASGQIVIWFKLKVGKKLPVFALSARHFANGYHLANWAIKISFWRNILLQTAAKDKCDRRVIFEI